jgi:hypothetical protein
MRRGIKTIVAELREHGRQCGIADCNFSPIPLIHRKAMKEHLQFRFDLWWKTWIAPKLDELETKAK